MGIKRNFSDAFKGLLNTNSVDEQYLDEKQIDQDKLNQNAQNSEYYKMLEEQLDSFSELNEENQTNAQTDNTANFAQNGAKPSDYANQSYAQRVGQNRNFAQNNPPISAYEKQNGNDLDNTQSHYDSLNAGQANPLNQSNNQYNDPFGRSEASKTNYQPLNSNNNPYIDSRNTSDSNSVNPNNSYIDSRNTSANFQPQNTRTASQMGQNYNGDFDPRNTATPNLNWNYAKNTESTNQPNHLNDPDAYKRPRNIENFGNPTRSNAQEIREVTIISENTQIIGDIRSFAALNVDGEVSGNIQTSKNITVQGKIVGDVAADDVIMLGSATQGRIVSKGTLTVSSDAIVLGDVKAQNINVDGKVKGNMQTNHKTVFGSNAVILGNITSASIAIKEGANIQGYVSTTMPRDMNVKKDFPDSISLENTDEKEDLAQAEFSKDDTTI